MTQGAVEGNAGLHRRDPQAARQDGAGGKDLLTARERLIGSGALRGPAFFWRMSQRRRVVPEATVPLIVGTRAASRAVDDNPFLTHWYYHLPNFILAALMYTLLGRVLLGLFVDPNSPNYIWRFFCRITDPVVAAVALVTPKAARAGRSSGCSAWCGCSGCASVCSISSRRWRVSRRGELSAHGPQLVLSSASPSSG